MSLMWLRQLAARMRGGEDGQVLILFIVLTPVIFLASAIAIDYGLWLSERRGVARAADLSSLAAVQDLPATPGQQEYTSRAACDAALDSCRAAFDWAERNNYTAGQDHVEVTVSYWCGNNLQTQPTNITVCVNENASSEGKSECSAALGKTDCDTIRVTVTKPAVRLFSGFFPALGFDVGFSADASVNYRVKHLDAVMAIDASGSMRGNPITQARIGADAFSTILFGDDPAASNVQIGYTPFRAGHDDPPYADPPGSDGNVPWIGALTIGNCNPPPAGSWAACLTKDDELLRSKYTLTETSINAPGANSGGTNTCIGLTDAGDVILGPNSGSLSADPLLDRVIVILTDGDNNANTGMDTCTLNKANALRAPGNGVEIYVVALSVPGNTGDPDNPDPNPGENPSTPGFCNQVGTDNNGNTESRRLLKCIASSSPGTNNHYFETVDAGDLGNVFLNLAYEIAGRALAGN